MLVARVLSLLLLPLQERRQDPNEATGGALHTRNVDQAEQARKDQGVTLAIANATAATEQHKAKQEEERTKQEQLRTQQLELQLKLKEFE